MAFSSLPARLGPFVIRNVLCTTGAGAMLRVEHQQGGRPCTVMLLDPDLPAWPARLRDRQLLPAHPRLCSLSQGEPAMVKCDERTFYYVGAESLSGWTMLDEIAREGAVHPLSRAVRFCAEAAEALGCAHAAGLTHGHLEPGCLFIQTFDDADPGHIKLLGAGLDVTAAPSSRAARYRLPGAPAATTLSQRTAADLFALGGVLYHMVTGHPPDLGALGDLLPPSAFAPVPPQLSRLMLRLLARDRRKRPSSAAAVHDALIDIDLRPGVERPAPAVPAMLYHSRPARA